eukprot:6176069-Pleurochrysis_carterae.AAC.2
MSNHRDTHEAALPNHMSHHTRALTTAVSLPPLKRMLVRREESAAALLVFCLRHVQRARTVVGRVRSLRCFAWLGFSQHLPSSTHSVHFLWSRSPLFCVVT